MIDFLGKLFGNSGKVKLMRLFIFNAKDMFTVEEISKRTNLTPPTIRHELAALLKAQFVKKTTSYKQISRKVRGKTTTKKVRLPVYLFNEKFPFGKQFENILMEATPFRGDSLVKRLSKSGKMKLIVVSGIFLQEPESRLDLMIVGDRLNKTTLERTVKSLEGEIGRELKYAIFDTPDFNYRMSVYDRLVRDVLDYPHQKLLDKVSLPSAE